MVIVCGIERVTDDSGTRIHKIIPIAGDIDGRHVDEKITRLKTSDSHADSGKEGFRAVLNGGLYEKKPQQAIVEFICDPNKTGLEGLKKEEEGKDKRKREEKKEEGDDKEPERKDPKEGESPEEQSLKFISYDTTDAGKDVLRLVWRTKYACENVEKDPGADQGNHWGFFTWFIIM